MFAHPTLSRRTALQAGSVSLLDDLSGRGVKGGKVIGSSDKTGGYPATDPQTPENFAATISSALGLAKTTAWRDAEARPHYLYHADPMPTG